MVPPAESLNSAPPPLSSSTPPAPAPTRRTLLGALARFAILGVLVFVAESSIRAQLPPVRGGLRVVVPQGLDEPSIRARVDDALLVEEAIALGWAAHDPVIRRRLLENMRFARGLPESGGLSAEELTGLLDEARALGMERSDAVVRRRLRYLAERALTEPARREVPDEAALEALLREESARFSTSPRVRYAQRFLSRDRRGDQLSAAAEAMGARLRAHPEDIRALAGEGDPLHFASSRFVRLGELRERLGGGLADALADAPLGRWSGPYPSELGLHFVFVIERREPAPLPLAEVRERLIARYRERRRDELLSERLETLREMYTVEVVPEAEEGP